jgi:pSer/pThr/pTyr-binding forkhead associated (FHA) protein
MQNLKIEIINSFVPKAVLIPLTEDAKLTITETSNSKKLIPINTFPFKIGRESRMGKSDRGLFVKLRIMSNHARPNNDIYLVDNKNTIEISKEHFEISNDKDEYLIKDRNSTLGTKLNNIEIGKEQSKYTHILKDGDIIKIGSNHSKYEFQFLILSNNLKKDFQWEN